MHTPRSSPRPDHASLAAPCEDRFIGGATAVNKTASSRQALATAIGPNLRGLTMSPYNKEGSSVLMHASGRA